MAKAKPKPDDPEQSKRFIELAESVFDKKTDTGEALKRAIKKVALSPKTKNP